MSTLRTSPASVQSIADLGDLAIVTPRKTRRSNPLATVTLDQFGRVIPNDWPLRVAAKFRLAGMAKELWYTDHMGHAPVFISEGAATKALRKLYRQFGHTVTAEQCEAVFTDQQTRSEESARLFAEAWEIETAGQGPGEPTVASVDLATTIHLLNAPHGYASLDTASMVIPSGEPSPTEPTPRGWDAIEADEPAAPQSRTFSWGPMPAFRGFVREPIFSPSRSKACLTPTNPTPIERSEASNPSPTPGSPRPTDGNGSGATAPSAAGSTTISGDSCQERTGPTRSTFAESVDSGPSSTISLEIKGRPYHASPLFSPDGLHAWRIEAPGSDYEVAEGPTGPRCSCPSFAHNSARYPGAGCKHTAALVDACLIAAGWVMPTLSTEPDAEPTDVPDVLEGKPSFGLGITPEESVNDDSLDLPRGRDLLARGDLRCVDRVACLPGESPGSTEATLVEPDVLPSWEANRVDLSALRAILRTAEEESRNLAELSRVAHGMAQRLRDLVNEASRASWPVPASAAIDFAPTASNFDLEAMIGAA